MPHYPPTRRCAERVAPRGFRWDKSRHHHGCLIHVEIIDGKVWVQRDGTEDGVTDELVQAGIPKEEIVLDFHEPSVRPYTGFAVA